MAVIVVLATEHPERDAWVDEQADAEAYFSGGTPGPYHGVHEAPSGARLHVFGAEDEALALTEWWAQLTKQKDPEG